MNTSINKSAMTGFDPQFSDLCDYILKITYWIWEGKQPELCADYYSQDCPVYTLAGITIGAEEVIRNTANTQAAFPDRTLDAANIIWGGNAESGFHSSHLIDTKMTAMGESEFGPATGKQGRGFVIAHCICKDNKVVEEWLVRDNYSLASQFGADPMQMVARLSASPEPKRLHDWRTSELNRLSKTPNGWIYQSEELRDSDAVLMKAIHAHWSKPNAETFGTVYDPDAVMHAPKGAELQGQAAIQEFYTELHDALSDVVVSLDYACNNSYNQGDDHLAVRWTLSGTHSGGSVFGAPVNKKLLILGESHYRLRGGKVVEEWCVFDLLSLLVQVERLRNEA